MIASAAPLPFQIHAVSLSPSAFYIKSLDGTKTSQTHSISYERVLHLQRQLAVGMVNGVKAIIVML